VAAALGLADQAQAIRLARLRLINAQVVLSEEIWLPQPLFSPLLTIELADFDDLLYPLYESRCGQAIASAKETLTVESASPEVATNLGISEGAPVVVIERLALGFDRKPLEWRRSHGAADSFRYQVDIC